MSPLKSNDKLIYVCTSSCERVLLSTLYSCENIELINIDSSCLALATVL